MESTNESGITWQGFFVEGTTFGYRGDARGNMTYFKKDRTVKQSAISEITKDEFMATRPRSVNA